MLKVHFPWDRPVLHSAAEFLLDEFTQNGRLDMRHVLLAFPGARAASRMEELLLELVERKVAQSELDPAWHPPRLLTIGRLPELLYPQLRPLADDVTQQFAWIAALDEMQKNEPDVLFHLFHEPPDLEDISSRLALAKVFSNIHQELAAETLRFDDVQKKCVTLYHGQTAESTRWQTLARLQEKYLAILDHLELWDVQTARIVAIQKKEVKTDSTIVLVGTVDMNLTQKRILDLVSDNVVSLVFAPESHHHLFDQYGCLHSKRWKDVTIPITKSQIEAVDTPNEQAIAAALWIAQKTKSDRVAEEITLGVPDENVIPLMQQQLLQAGAKARAVGGIPLTRTAPYRFLEIVAKLVKTNLYSCFADLLRHPDVESFLRNSFAQHETKKSAFDLFLTESDRYYTKFLPVELDDDWRSYIDPTHPNASKMASQFEVLRESRERIQSVLQPLLEPGRLSSSAWCDAISPILHHFFDSSEIDAVDTLLEKIAELPDLLERKFNASEFLEMVLRDLQSIRIPPPADKNTIEILGWLDLVMDDAPILAVTCLNEGTVPSFLNSDLFLPDGIRAALKIEDNDRRFARDAYAMSVILATKSDPSDIKLITGRHDTKGNPLLPSRLLFADSPEIVAERVKQFFKEEEHMAPVVFSGSFLATRKEAAFKPPEIPVPPEPILSMRVTEFRDYLACPYRYALRHLLHLDVMYDHDEELDAAKFGNVLHEVLRRFGISDINNSTDHGVISAFLGEQLDNITTEIYGSKPRAVVEIQFEQARHRLNAFAKWQATWAMQGNRILYAEWDMNQKNATGVNAHIGMEDGRQMGLRGRIDRIDVNLQTGKGYLLDYKSSDTAVKPEAAHFKSGKWVDLQLPLYWHVIRQSPTIFPGISDWSAGYIVLPKDVTKTGLMEAEWGVSEYQSAMETARGVIENVWDGNFGPEHLAKIPPRFSEMYSAICLDT